MSAAIPSIAAAKRFASVDALRGWAVAAMLFVNDPGDWNHVWWPFDHAEWNGFTPTDLVFPLFLFVVGVSIALGVVPQLEAGKPVAQIRRGILVRGLKLIGLGLLLHAFATWCFDREFFRPCGVLQRIGLCFIAAGFIATWLKPALQWRAIAVLLVGYWALLHFNGGYDEFVNLADRIDFAVLGVHCYALNLARTLGHDPEGLLGTLPAIATTLLGVRAGAWLRAGKTAHIFVAGIVALLLGWLVGHDIPINKNLWTSSFVLWAGGWSLLLLGAYHLAIEYWKLPAFGRRYGGNAIAAYVGAYALLCVLVALKWFEPIYRVAFVGWIAPRFGPTVASHAFALAWVALFWLQVWWMDKRKWYWKI